MEEFCSFKDFESVRLKATYNIEIGDRIIEPGETIAYFDKVQIAGLNEVRDYITAHGGYEDRTRVIWDRTKELHLTFSRGVFSKEQFALMYNSRLIEVASEDLVKVPMREFLESDENGIIQCKYAPVHDIYVYNKATGLRIDFTIVTGEDEDGTRLQIETPYLDVIVDYYFDYNGNTHVVKIGQRLLTGFVELEGITRIKDDVTGQIVTGIIKIPHLRLMSDLSIRLGAAANPVVATFGGTAFPVGPRGNTRVVEFYYLSDDIQADL